MFISFGYYTWHWADIKPWERLGNSHMLYVLLLNEQLVYMWLFHPRSLSRRVSDLCGGVRSDWYDSVRSHLRQHRGVLQGHHVGCYRRFPHTAIATIHVRKSSHLAAIIGTTTSLHYRYVKSLPHIWGSGIPGFPISKGVAVTWLNEDVSRGPVYIIMSTLGLRVFYLQPLTKHAWRKISMQHKHQ